MQFTYPQNIIWPMPNHAHQLHQQIYIQISTLISKMPSKGFQLLISSDCSRLNGQRLPFFLSDFKNKSYDTQVTNVDLVIINDKKEVVFVCEIEESDRTPIRLYGKFFSLYSSSYLKIPQSSIPYPFASLCVFLQIVSNSSHPSGTKKLEQCENIESTIQTIIINNPKYCYHLIYGDLTFFNHRKNLLNSDLLKAIINCL